MQTKEHDMYQTMVNTHNASSFFAYSSTTLRKAGSWTRIISEGNIMSLPVLSSNWSGPSGREAMSEAWEFEIYVYQDEHEAAKKALLTPRFTIMWKFRRPPLFDQETKVLITHCVLRKCPRPPVSTCLGVAPTKSMCTKKSYNFSIRESHAFSNQRTQMLLVGTLRANKKT